MGKWRKRTKRAGKQVRVREQVNELLAHGDQLLAHGEILIEQNNKKQKTTVGTGSVGKPPVPEVKSLVSQTDDDNDFTANVASSALVCSTSSSSSSSGAAGPGGERHDGLPSGGADAGAYREWI